MSEQQNSAAEIAKSGDTPAEPPDISSPRTIHPELHERVQDIEARAVAQEEDLRQYLQNLTLSAPGG